MKIDRLRKGKINVCERQLKGPAIAREESVDQLEGAEHAHSPV